MGQRDERLEEDAIIQEATALEGWFDVLQQCVRESLQRNRAAGAKQEGDWLLNNTRANVISDNTHHGVVVIKGCNKTIALYFDL